MAQLKANKRKDAGKGAARTHRREGRVPAILYGHGEESVSITVDRNELDRLVHSISIENTIVDLDVEGGGYKVLIREIQRHPVRKDFVHVDFFHVAMDEKIHLEIPVVIVGTAEGVKNKGGILDHQLREIEVYCLPGNIPEKIEVDVSALDIGESIHVSDLDLGDVDVETDLDRTVVAVLAPTVAAEPEEAEAGEELAEPQLVGREREEAGEEEESE
jgi:large subunit ribosomal protein L25